eukprot:UN01121
MLLWLDNVNIYDYNSDCTYERKIYMGRLRLRRMYNLRELTIKECVVELVQNIINR